MQTPGSELAARLRRQADALVAQAEELRAMADAIDGSAGDALEVDEILAGPAVAILAALAGAGRAVHLVDLAELAEVDRGTAAAHVEKLECRGLVKRLNGRRGRSGVAITRRGRLCVPAPH